MTLPKRLYAVHPGWVKSADGQEHFITARRLMDLHGVSPRQCVVWTGLGQRLSDYIHLWPRDDGNYTLPGGKA